eukprot:SAG31_NODE_10404_length_1142_cov_1.204219_1_plen_307_part_00
MGLIEKYGTNRESVAVQVFRPHTVDFSHVNYGMISGPTFTRNPNHVLELGCDNCELSHISVLNPPSTGDCEKTNACSHNTDAVDVHGTPFYIHNVNFTTGDVSEAALVAAYLKSLSTLLHAQDNVAVHANHTLVEDSYFGTGHGASIGSMCDESITNLTVRNMTFVGTTSGCKIKAHPNCHGHVWDTKYQDIVMHDVQLPINLDQYYGIHPEKMKHPPPNYVLMERISYKNLTSYGGGDKHKNVVGFSCASDLNGRNNCHVTLTNVTFKDLGSDGMKTGMHCGGVNGTVTGLTGINDCLKQKRTTE